MRGPFLIISLQFPRRTPYRFTLVQGGGGAPASARQQPRRRARDGGKWSAAESYTGSGKECWTDAEIRREKQKAEERAKKEAAEEEDRASKAAEKAAAKAAKAKALQEEKGDELQPDGGPVSTDDSNPCVRCESNHDPENTFLCDRKINDEGKTCDAAYHRECLKTDGERDERDEREERLDGKVRLLSDSCLD